VKGDGATVSRLLDCRVEPGKDDRNWKAGLLIRPFRWAVRVALRLRFGRSKLAKVHRTFAFACAKRFSPPSPFHGRVATVPSLSPRGEGEGLTSGATRNI